MSPSEYLLKTNNPYCHLVTINKYFVENANFTSWLQ